MHDSYFNQRDAAIRCEWGSDGLAALRADSAVIIIVDVLSFCTCVDIAVGNGALLYPYRWRDGTAEAFARDHGALLASHERSATGRFSLSPATLMDIPAGTRLVLPSPNGATLSASTGTIPTLAGCLRNATAVARAAEQLGGTISVIAAGERWDSSQIRPAIEDLIGAGAIIAQLQGGRSPEAEIAVAAFERAQSDLLGCLSACGSGRELIGRGFAEDVRLAAAYNRSVCAPLLRDQAFVLCDAR